MYENWRRSLVECAAGKDFFPALPSAMTMSLGKEFFFKKKIQTLPSAGQRALGKEFFFKKNPNFAERRTGALGK